MYVCAYIDIDMHAGARGETVYTPSSGLVAVQEISIFTIIITAGNFG